MVNLHATLRVDTRMGTSTRQTERQNHPSTGVALAKAVAPEDLSAGQYVSILRVTYEVPSFLWGGCESFGDPTELVRLAMIPDEAVEPLKVKAVCLPFVLVRNASGQVQTLDVRRCHLARLDDHYARAAWKASRPKRPERKGSKKKA